MRSPTSKDQCVRARAVCRRACPIHPVRHISLLSQVHVSRNVPKALDVLIADAEQRFKAASAGTTVHLYSVGSVDRVRASPVLIDRKDLWLPSFAGVTIAAGVAARRARPYCATEDPLRSGQDARRDRAGFAADTR